MSTQYIRYPNNTSGGAYHIAIGESGGTGATTVNLPTTGPGGGETFILDDFGGTGSSGGNSITIDAGTGNLIRSLANPTGAQTFVFTTNGETHTIKRIISPSGSTGQEWKLY